MLKDRSVQGTLVLFAVSCSLLWFTGVTSVRHLFDDLIAVYLVIWGVYAFLSDHSRVEIRHRFTLTTVTLLLCLGCLEAPAVLGWLDYRDLLPSPTVELWAKPGYAQDQELIWVRKPFSHVKGAFVRGNIGEALCAEPTSGTRFDLRYDAHGFRNPPDLQRADLAVIGDSNVEAPMVADAELFTNRLANQLNRTVANLGQLGYNPYQELAVLKRYALDLRPNTIVWVFFEGNDLAEMRLYPERRRMVEARTQFDAIWDRSFTRNVLAAIVAPRTCVPHSGIQQQFGIVKDQQGQRQRMYFVTPLDELSSSDSQMLQETRRLLEVAHALCRERRIDFVVAFAPAKYRVYRDVADFQESGDVMKHWGVNDLPGRLQSLVAAIDPGIGYVDLTPALQRESAKGLLTYYLDDTHWTAEGHRVVADTLRETLRNRPAR